MEEQLKELEELQLQYLKILTYTQINDLIIQYKALLSEVSVFSLGKCPLYNRDVYIRTRGQIYGPDKWVCMLENSQGWCLGKNNRWYYEGNPSSRTDAFIKQTRFDTHEEAREAYKAHLLKREVQKLTM